MPSGNKTFTYLGGAPRIEVQGVVLNRDEPTTVTDQGASAVLETMDDVFVVGEWTPTEVVETFSSSTYSTDTGRLAPATETAPPLPDRRSGAAPAGKSARTAARGGDRKPHKGKKK